jgi:hypothetical protein
MPIRRERRTPGVSATSIDSWLEGTFGAGVAVRRQMLAFFTDADGMRQYVIWWILCAVIWIAIAFWPARVAGRTGHGVVGYFIFSLFFFPAALIVAYLVPNRARVAAI